MKLVDIVAGKVVIHPELLMIPCMKNVWEKTKDKDLATKYISYIILKNKFDSPYVLRMAEEEIPGQLKQELFNDSLYELPNYVLDAEVRWVDLMDTMMLRLLRNARKKLESVSKYYQDSVGDALDERAVKDILAGMGALGKTIESLSSLEVAVKNEEVVSSKVRGGGKMNDFEIPVRN